MAVALDDEKAMAEMDVSGMMRQMSSLPASLDTALGGTADVGMGVRKLCLCGLGGSAMGADVLLDHLERTSEVYGSVVRDVRLPGWVDFDTLVVLISYSGGTRETLAMYEEARWKGAKMAAITSGGKLAELCARDRVPLVRVPQGIQPRAALGHLLGSLAKVVGAAGMSPIQEEIRTMLPFLKAKVEGYSPLVPTKENDAKQIALRLHRATPFIYSSRNVRSAGRRWQGQINENAKMLCSYGELPEADHNQVVGWVDGKRSETNRPVILRAGADQGMMAGIVEATISILTDFKLDPVVVDLDGTTMLENVMGGIVLGDHVSYYLAMMNGVDPTPVSSITELKKRLE
jgi:glucose/mannose-6-phosphate isomerase